MAPWSGPGLGTRRGGSAIAVFPGTAWILASLPQAVTAAGRGVSRVFRIWVAAAEDSELRA